MRRIPVILALTVTISAWVAAQPPQAGSAAQPKAPAGAAAMLTVDSIMRGPKLVGTSPSAIEWSKDSSKIYFTWQKAGDEQPGSYVVNRDGTGMRQLNPGETPDLPVVTGRLDRARKRTVSAEGGDIVITDVGTGTRRVDADVGGREQSALGAQRHGRDVPARRQFVSDVGDAQRDG